MDVDADKLRAELRERDELLAFIAHELRNPLHTLGMQLGSVRAALQGDAATSTLPLERLKKSQLTLARYVERVTLLLNLAQQNVDAFSVRLANVDIAGFLSRLPQRFADDAEFHHTTLRYQGPDALVLRTDLQAVEHIVHNLLSNALKYAAASEIVVALDTDGHRARIAVRDDGVGIPPEQQSTVFEKFQRGRLVPKEGGFGLGLWIVSRLVQAMDGQVELHSEPGHGSSFTVVLPIAAPTPNS